MVKRLTGIAFLLTVMLVFAACGNNQADPGGEKASDTESHEQHQLPNGDMQETTASKDTLPKFLDKQPLQIRQVYQIAAEYADLLQWIPCYCGCGESAGHESNKNCFVNKIEEDGSVIWDDHGTRCNTCLQIAVESAAMKKEGKSDMQIREFIDDKYKTGYAAPTKTPMPS